MKKLKKIDMGKRQEMLDKLSVDESNRLIGGYDINLPGGDIGGGTVTPYVSYSGGGGGGGITYSYPF
jgi:hypothetical protein